MAFSGKVQYCQAAPGHWMHPLLVFILCAQRNWAKRLLAVAHIYCPGNKAAAASIILFNLQLDDLLALYLDLISVHELVSRFLFQKLLQVPCQITPNTSHHGKGKVGCFSMQQMYASYKCEIVSNLSQTSKSRGLFEAKLFLLREANCSVTGLCEVTAHLWFWC